MKEINKIQDTFNDKKSNADLHYDSFNIRHFYKKLRRNSDLPQNLNFDIDTAQKIAEIYKLRGFQFGNWVTTEDRYNYLAAFYLCLYDLQKVLRFKNNNLGIGGELGIALGARGVSKALAHFEPANLVINISRYKREDVMKKEIEAWGTPAPANIPKEVRFFHTGGIGSFAHEYGHFLDLYFGRFFDQDKNAVFLTGNSRSVSKERFQYPASSVLRNMMEDLYESIMWKDGKPTDFHLRLKETEDPYINNRQEVFARVFEHYVHYTLLHKYGIYNHFMTKTKYKAEVYLTEKELKRVIYLIDKLIEEMRKHS